VVLAIQREVSVRIAPVGIAGVVRRCIGQPKLTVRRPAAQNVHRPAAAIAGHTDPWVSERKFILVGMAAMPATIARFFIGIAARDAVSRFHPQANLHEAPPDRRSKKGGRPRTKGSRCPSPGGRQRSKAKRFTVNWYRQTRRVQLIWGEGHWVQAADGLVPVRWVFVQDAQGTHRDEYFYSTDRAWRRTESSSSTPDAGASSDISGSARHLGFSTPRNWRQKRAADSGPVCWIVQRREPDLSRHTRGKGRDPRPSRGTPRPNRPSATHDVRASAVLGQRFFSTVAQKSGVKKLSSHYAACCWTS